MNKKKTIVYCCQVCEHQVPKWLGKCPECGSWNSFEEGEVLRVKNSLKTTLEKESEGPQRISLIKLEKYERASTNIFEFDRVLGGGIVKGSLVLIGGEPGVGKSTLLSKVMLEVSKKEPLKNILYISGEESSSQVAERVKRIGGGRDNVYIYHQTSWQKIREQIQKIKPELVILDSIQTTYSNEISSAPGSISQIREVTFELMNYVKKNDLTGFIIGHITKEGNIAGPKLLEHMVDTVIYFEGDQFGKYRILRAIKNRFGDTNETGIFEMTEHGLEEVKNPSAFLLQGADEKTIGRTISTITEGSRTLFVEIQALVIENKYSNGRRTTQGVDPNRLSMLIAVVEKYLEIPLGENDIYLNITGGMKLQGREADLSIIGSLLSSYLNKPLKKSPIMIGEVGLNGEVRAVPKLALRVKEMKNMNYRHLVTAGSSREDIKTNHKLEAIGVENIKELIEAIF